MITIDGLDQAHARVALDILEADGGVQTYEGSVPDQHSLPYALVYTQVAWPGEGDGKALDGRTGTCVTRWIVHSVGETDAAARIVSNRVRQLLVNARPTITGRSCGLIQQDIDPPPPQRNEETGTLLMDVIASYALTTFNAL